MHSAWAGVIGLVDSGGRVHTRCNVQVPGQPNCNSLSGMGSGGAFRLDLGLWGWGWELGHDAVFVATRQVVLHVAFGLGLIPWCGGWGELKSSVREFFGLCTGRRPNGAWSQPGRSLAD